MAIKQKIREFIDFVKLMRPEKGKYWQPAPLASAGFKNLRPIAESLEILRILTGVGGDLGRKDKLGRTPLHYACMPESAPAGKAGGRTAMHAFAIAERGREAIVQLMIDLGADPNAPGLEGNTPLHFATTGDPQLTARLRA